MRKVISGSLAGNAYQFEEGAYLAVQGYLARASASHAGSADRAEILADLERSLADKCDTFLGKHKNVITNEEAQQILREVGASEIHVADPGAAASSGPAKPDACTNAPRNAPFRRRLYRIPSEGMLGGVCAGIAAHFGVDVVWVRLAYILLACSTGIWILVWLAQLLITPVADSAREACATAGMQGAAGR
jgi:phage shock protein PspC (stress-responsive transcriptional regulator)